MCLWGNKAYPLHEEIDELDGCVPIFVAYENEVAMEQRESF